MSLETASYIHQLNPANPSGADKVKEGDDHIRMMKAVLKATFPGITGPLSSSVTHTLLNSFAASLVPRGVIVMWTGSSETVPAGWAICDGRPAQWADGSATITTPDFTDRVPVGASNGHAVGTKYGQASKGFTTEAAGAHVHGASTGAAGSHTHGGTNATAITEAQMPSHYHFSVVNAQASTPLQNLSNDYSFAVVNPTDGISRYALAGVGGSPTLGRSSAAGGSQGHAHSINADGVHTHPVYIDPNGNHAHNITIDVTQPALAVFFIMKL